MAVDVQDDADAMVTAPLEFDERPLHETAGAVVQPDAFSPTLCAATTDYGQFNRTIPSSACTLEVQLGAVTSRVCQLEIADTEDRLEPRRLFRNNMPPLVASSPVRWSDAPPKSRAPSVPTRQSARHAANTSIVPVVQRASLRIVKKLGLLGPRLSCATSTSL
ncbi:hypothetical protein D1007_31776 [Hordeum vulgare]|nr:hypothetical protein D1007_31776 [Hordeum vulgare]